MRADKLVEQEDWDLIQRMASRDANALDAFYERHKNVAFGLILHILGNRSDAEDVLVDVFWQMWQQSPGYDSSRGKPIDWLLKIARTHAIDRLRKLNRPRRPAASVTLESEALQTLSKEQRIVLEMAYFQGLTPGKIAAALGEPLETVKDLIRTGMMHLKKFCERR